MKEIETQLKHLIPNTVTEKVELIVAIDPLLSVTLAAIQVYVPLKSYVMFLICKRDLNLIPCSISRSIPRMMMCSDAFKGRP